MNHLTRRHFIQSVTGASAALAASPLFAATGGGEGEVRVGLVGCGGRGSGALEDFKNACEVLGLQARVVALADAFADQVQRLGTRLNVPPDRQFAGFDAYRKVMASDAEFVLLATPPNFRPLHFAAAVAAGKHVFAEKPVAVDPPGVRQFIEAGRRAAAAGLAIVAGTQRRYGQGYQLNKARIDAGAIGPILGGVVQWNGQVPWIRHRQPGQSDAEYITRNWVNFTELSGDHICEQHVHNIDVANWFLGRAPVSALGFGGRARRQTGNQFDFFSVDLDYGDGVHIHSQCRQLAGAYSRVGEFFRGALGDCAGGGKLTGREVSVPEVELEHGNEYVQEHVALIKGVRAGRPQNDAQAVAEATMAAIMGRISAYTGKLVRWSDVMITENSEFFNLTLHPAAAEFEAGEITAPPEVPAVPGEG